MKLLLVATITFCTLYVDAYKLRHKRAAQSQCDACYDEVENKCQALEGPAEKKTIQCFEAWRVDGNGDSFKALKHPLRLDLDYADCETTVWYSSDACSMCDEEIYSTEEYSTEEYSTEDEYEDSSDEDDGNLELEIWIDCCRKVYGKSERWCIDQLG